MIRQQVREQLEQLCEADYRQFNQKLLPGVTDILGVRVPKLRQIAKRIAKDDAQEYLEEIKQADWKSGMYYEEKMLYGLVTGYARMDEEECSGFLDEFVPHIDNWGVCDSCCMTYKWMKKQPRYWLDYLNRQIQTGTEFGIRFGLVCMLAHFVDEEHIQEIYEVCSRTHMEDYYARMAAAWLVSVCFAAFPERTYEFLQDDRMDDFTHNKAVQKTCESYRVSKEWKVRVRRLRRGN